MHAVPAARPAARSPARDPQHQSDSRPRTNGTVAVAAADAPRPYADFKSTQEKQGGPPKLNPAAMSSADRGAAAARLLAAAGGSSASAAASDTHRYSNERRADASLSPPQEWSNHRRTGSGSVQKGAEPGRGISGSRSTLPQARRVGRAGGGPPPLFKAKTKAAPAFAGPAWTTGCVDLYEKVEKVGQGTYGEVFKAKEKATGKIVALKKVLMEYEKEGFPITTIREIKILRQLDHTNIVCLQGIVADAKDAAEHTRVKGAFYMVRPPSHAADAADAAAPMPCVL